MTKSQELEETWKKLEEHIAEIQASPNQSNRIVELNDLLGYRDEVLMALIKARNEERGVA